MWRVLAWLLAAALALTVLPVLLLRWLPPPTSSYMLQSPTRPVQYHWEPARRISEPARRAVIAAEDQKFWTHRGFDLEAIEKAREHNRRSRRIRGASTISQQTAKNLFLWSGGGYFRKGIEAGYTVLIEALWPKSRILEMYLNIAEFGPGIYGVEAAAQAYFHKSAAELTPSEAARLAAVLPSPRHWSVTRPGAYVQRRAAWILGQMGYGHRASEPEPEIPEELQREIDEDQGESEAPVPAPAAPDEAAPPPLDPDDEPESPPALEAPPPEAAPEPLPPEPELEPAAPASTP